MLYVLLHFATNVRLLGKHYPNHIVNKRVLKQLGIISLVFRFRKLPKQGTDFILCAAALDQFKVSSCNIKAKPFGIVLGQMHQNQLTVTGN